MINQMMQKFRSLSLNGRLCLIMSIIFIFSLIPLLHIGLYAHAAGDDYAYGLAAHLCWKETHSLPAVIQTVFENTKSYYQTWQGTWSSIFLMSLQPSVFSERLYCLTAPLMLSMLIGSHFMFFHVLFTRYLRLARSLRINLTLAVLFLSTQILDSGKSAFFWYNGAIHYVFMHSCMIFLIGLLLLSLRLRSKSGVSLGIFFSCVLAFIISGSNYVTALLTPVLIVFLCFLFLLFQDRKGLLCLLPLFFALAGLGINVLAPGNAIRISTQIDSMNPVEAVYYSFLYAIEGMGAWTTVYLIFFALLLFPFLFAALYRVTFDFPLPGLVSGFSFCFVAASYTPSLYSMGHVIIFDRTLNIMRMFYYLLFFLNLVYLTGWLAKLCQRYDFFAYFPELFKRLKEHFVRSFTLTMVAFFLCLLLFSNKDKVTTLSAVHSLWKGDARSYHEESLNRITLISVEGTDEVWVPNFSVCPPLLDPQWLSTNPDEYPNPSVAKWFGKTTLHLSNVY